VAHLLYAERDIFKDGSLPFAHICRPLRFCTSCSSRPRPCCALPWVTHQQGLSTFQAGWTPQTWCSPNDLCCKASKMLGQIRLSDCMHGRIAQPSRHSFHPCRIRQQLHTKPSFSIDSQRLALVAPFLSALPSSSQTAQRSIRPVFKGKRST
jgi:hypothetical protein